MDVVLFYMMTVKSLDMSSFKVSPPIHGGGEASSNRLGKVISEAVKTGSSSTGSKKDALDLLQAPLAGTPEAIRPKPVKRYRSRPTLSIGRAVEASGGYLGMRGPQTLQKVAKAGSLVRAGTIERWTPELLEQLYPNAPADRALATLSALNALLHMRQKSGNYQWVPASRRDITRLLALATKMAENPQNYSLALPAQVNFSAFNHLMHGEAIPADVLKTLAVQFSGDFMDDATALLHEYTPDVLRGRLGWFDGGGGKIFDPRPLAIRIAEDKFKQYQSTHLRRWAQDSSATAWSNFVARASDILKPTTVAKQTAPAKAVAKRPRVQPQAQVVQVVGEPGLSAQPMAQQPVSAAVVAPMTAQFSALEAGTAETFSLPSVEQVMAPAMVSVMEPAGAPLLFAKVAQNHVTLVLESAPAAHQPSTVLDLAAVFNQEFKIKSDDAGDSAGGSGGYRVSFRIVDLSAAERKFYSERLEDVSYMAGLGYDVSNFADSGEGPGGGDSEVFDGPTGLARGNSGLGQELEAEEQRNAARRQQRESNEEAVRRAGEKFTKTVLDGRRQANEDEIDAQITT